MSMTGSTPALNPAQERTLHDLMGLGQPRPSFDSHLAAELRAELQAGLAAVDERLELGGVDLFVSKGELSRVHQCERHWANPDFAWGPATAKGWVAHKAIELGVFATGERAPMDLVDMALDRQLQDPDDLGRWLLEAPAEEIAELRAEATNVVTSFEECFPPLKAAWRPRAEAPVKQQIGRVTFSARVDLALGRSEGDRAGMLIVDFKTGRPYPVHLDDLRFYALVATLRIGVPPFRVASYYLDDAKWHAEDIDEAILEVTVRRVVDGAVKMAELRLAEREATFTPGPACRWCSVRDTCEGPALLDDRAFEEGL
jgi:hypothetical protein